MRLFGNKYVLVNRNSPTKAGGVGMYIKSEIKYKLRYDLNMNIDNCEDIWVELIQNGMKFITSTIYRHPRHNFMKFQDSLTHTLTKLEKCNIKYYILGDINIDFLRYSDHNRVKFYVDTLHSVNARNLINKPTRLTEHSFSLIDHVYTNDSNNEIQSGIVATDISDHLPTFIKITCTNNPHDSKAYVCKTTRDMKNFDLEMFRTDIYIINFNNYLIFSLWIAMLTTHLINLKA